MRKNGTTSNVPALVTVFLPQALKTAAAAADAGESGVGADGREEKDAMVVISWWKCWTKGAWKDDMMLRRWVSLKSVGVGRLVRYDS
jgi:hypothetical protein